ncbi:HAD-IIB family hydrolase [Henriciella barbarensis]|uniref:sucrose-phosphate synthase n=1 Tax=Henriciella barbarensis TaxID=86342 RepID=A0A399QW57_9PROT|nr:HAD-IIB family hydrolase [Henriciella barbarensis]RIJ21649.1 HAD-IIB family hydrolase [Henriciella barbarensis]
MMFIMHIALQGCLTAPPVHYGCTPDTGGHIKYLLELVDGAERAGAVRQEIITRRCKSPNPLADCMQPREKLSSRSSIVRVEGASLDYLAKEDLYRENDVFAANLIDYIRRLDRRPDIIHAHYADAGWVAHRVKEALGIPYMFTAHSLGRVKALAGLDADAAAALRTRIAIEEDAIAGADRIITSSRDEAEYQYSLYRSTRPEKVLLNPPGCDFTGFQSDNDALPDASLITEISRFLTEPGKRPLLALSRPVKKKNLAGIVRAYGESPALQELSNLIIFAGIRDDIEEADSENRKVLQELFYLIDRYNLYGKVALPKSHEPHQVAGIYALAADLQGVFVNVAYNEPFGLTFLEAAASGLPVVATSNGGPNDIVNKLGNGVLADPNRPDEVADAVLTLLRDDEFYEQCATSGLENISFYSWERHCREYVLDIEGLLRQPMPALARTVSRDFILASDIDNTLVGEARSLSEFSQLCSGPRDFHFAVATGRSLQDAMLTLRAWNAPLPEILVTSVGAEIYYSHDLDLRHLEADIGWKDHISEGWDRQAVEAALGGLPGLIPQKATEQRPFKLSFFTKNPAIVGEIKSRLKEDGLAATVIHSHDRFLDVLPHRASKGKALRWLCDRLGVDIADTIAAGDSGNDVDLLLQAGNGIVVGNHSHELEHLRTASNVTFSHRGYAGALCDVLLRRGQMQ